MKEGIQPKQVISIATYPYSRKTKDINPCEASHIHTRADRKTHFIQAMIVKYKEEEGGGGGTGTGTGRGRVGDNGEMNKHSSF